MMGAMGRGAVLILSAVLIEAGAVAAALGVDCPEPGRPTRASRDGLHLELHVIGISGGGLRDVMPQVKPSLVVMAGLAGGLDPSLQIGDVVVDGEVGESIVPTACRRGNIHTTRQIVSTPQDKAELFRATGALAVDMENDLVRAWARGRGAEFIGIRAISDRADQTLDPAVLRIVDKWGRPRVGALTSTLLKRPILIRQLMRLGSDSKKAATRLGEAVRGCVQAIPVQRPSQLS